MNIALVGMMGSGKSSVGAIVARRLRMRFADTDASVEKMTGKTITEIFSGRREQEFRKMERAAVKQAAALENTVIATGGGAVLDERNMDALRRNAVVFYLKASPKKLAARVGKDASIRPLLSGGNARKKLELLLEKREKQYELADFTVGAQGSPEKTAAQIIRRLKLAGKIVAVVSEDTSEKAIKQISTAARLGADAVEIRLDKLRSTPSGKQIGKLIRHATTHGLICIATFRKNGKATARDRADTLKTALALGANLADFDVGELASAGNLPREKIIASFHNFKATPSTRRLENLVAKMEMQASVVKIACNLQSLEDEKRLFKLLEESQRIGVKMTAFGIGENCRRSRIVASLKGAKLFYAHLGKKAARGQYSLKEAIELRKKWKQGN